METNIFTQIYGQTKVAMIVNVIVCWVKCY